MDLSDDLVVVIESEDDTAISLTVRSLSGRKISAHEFILELEQYLNDITRAEAERIQLGPEVH